MDGHVRLENFIYVEEHGFIFAYVPKVACTNWKCVFRHMMGYPDYLDAAKAHGKANGLVLLSDLPEETRARLLRSREIRKYTFVRDPYSRVLSAYLNKVEPYVRRGESIGQRRYFLKVYRRIKSFAAQAAPAEGGVNFFVFLLWLSRSGGPLARDEHWLPQSEIIGAGEVEFDYVGRFENLDADASKVMGLIGARCAFPRQGARPTGATGLLGQYVQDRERELIRSIYRRDFEALGYAG